jgi:hypothetical protein
MTDIFVRSTTGVDTNDGLSWSTAKATIAGAIGAMAAGDRLFVSQSHAEPSGATKNWTFPGTPALPNRIFCVSDADVAPTTLAKTATTAGGGSSTTSPVINGSVHLYGVELGYNAGVAWVLMGGSNSIDSVQVLEKCFLNITATGSTSVLTLGGGGTSNTARSRMLWLDTDLKFSGSGQRISVYQELTWRGGALRSGPTLSYLLSVGAQGRSCPVMIEGVDLTGLGATTDIVNGASSTGRVMIRSCTLPPNWAGNLVQGAVDPGLRVEMHNCDSGDTSYGLSVAAFSGTIRADTAMVKTGGYVEGTTPVSWKITTNGNPTPGSIGLETPEFVRKNPAAAGVEITVAVDILSDGDPLTSADVWLDVQYQGTSGLPKGSFTTTRAMLSPSIVPVSLATWPAGGSRTPQRLQAKFTPQRGGVIHCRVVLAKPSAAVFVDPKILVT